MICRTKDWYFISSKIKKQQIFIEPKGQHLIDNDIWKEQRFKEYFEKLYKHN